MDFTELYEDVKCVELDQDFFGFSYSSGESNYEQRAQPV
jgi:hypothetical protein